MGILSFLSAPSLRGGSFKPPKPLATARVRAAQHSRVASAPRRISVAARAVSKNCVLLAIRDNVCAATRMAQSERSRPLPDGSHCEGLKVLSSIQTNSRFMVLTSSPISCGLRRNAFAPALRATASESVPDIITIGIHRRWGMVRTCSISSSPFNTGSSKLSSSRSYFVWPTSSSSAAFPSMQFSTSQLSCSAISCTKPATIGLSSTCRILMA